MSSTLLKALSQAVDGAAAISSRDGYPAAGTLDITERLGVRHASPIIDGRIRHSGSAKP
jgi:hypothetical protein